MDDQEIFSTLIETLILPTGTVDIYEESVATFVYDEEGGGRILVVYAKPNYSDEDRARCVALGYGEDMMAMTIDHEIGHLLLAHITGQRTSPVMLAVAAGHPLPPEKAEPEEAAVLALQRYATSLDVTVRKLARSFGVAKVYQE